MTITQPMAWSSATGIPCTSTIWNPSDKDAGITLFNSNLTATRSTGSAWKSVRATTSHTTGKWYYEITNVTFDTTHGWMGGIADATMDLTNYMGVSTHGYGCQPVIVSLTWYNAGNQSPNCAQSGSNPGQVLEIAADLGGNLIWTRLSTDTAGFWNNSGSAVPGVSGGASLHIAGGAVAVFPAWSGNGNTGPADVGTINTAGSGGCTFTGSVPTGFAVWG
jgi:hypothetical protein